MSTGAITVSPAASAVHTTTGGGGGWWKAKTKAAPFLFLLPYFIITAIFFLYPLFYAAVLAFYQTAGPNRQAYVGWSNFNFILHDPDFYTALWNTIIFTICSICIQLPLSLGLALLLNARSDRLKGFFRLAIFSPNLVGQVFVGILFIMLFTPRYGLFNQFLHGLFGPIFGSDLLELNWRQVPTLVMPAIVIASLWMYVGFNMIYFLAALQNVDQSLVEAARIDGAGPGNVFLHVTLPSIAPVTTFVVVTSTIGSFQLFELPYTLLEQNFGPKNSGLTLVGYLYNQGFNTGDLGMAAAVGWIIAFMILIVSLIQIRISGTTRKDR
ncbi:MAG TPA: sugar ABC transporter permease [Tepidisphaeraceae bacterium]